MKSFGMFTLAAMLLIAACVGLSPPTDRQEHQSSVAAIEHTPPLVAVMTTAQAASASDISSQINAGRSIAVNPYEPFNGSEVNAVARSGSQLSRPKERRDGLPMPRSPRTVQRE